jgi:DNA-binding NarL/FixJ family response regulator
LSGWNGLSVRERQVAGLVADGGSNAFIAAELFLSIHTVRIHVSRVLQAFGVATRAGVAAALVTDSPTSGGAPAILTARQQQIVAHLVTGASNAQIAVELGIGVTTVEKHVGAILRRWGAGSRAGVVHIAMSSTTDADR